MSGYREKFGRKQELVIAALLRSSTIAGAATEAGISEATLFRWLQRPDFAAAYRRARHAAVEQAITQLQQATGEAVETLRSVQTDPDAAASARVNAAKTVLEMALKVRESEELERRLSALEEHWRRIAPTAKGGPE
jgi:DNA-binding MurR/RpiR family transcriptional regulator